MIKRENIKSKKKAVRIIVIVFLVVIGLYYVLFEMYIPSLGFGVLEDVDISNERILYECPDVEITEYDKQFLDNLLNAPCISKLADIEENSWLRFTADEAGFERYTLRSDENYELSATNCWIGADYHISVQFGFENSKDIYLLKKQIRVLSIQN